MQCYFQMMTARSSACAATVLLGYNRVQNHFILILWIKFVKKREMQFVVYDRLIILAFQFNVLKIDGIKD